MLAPLRPLAHVSLERRAFADPSGSGVLLCAPRAKKSGTAVLRGARKMKSERRAPLVHPGISLLFPPLHLKDQVLSATNGAGLLFTDKVRDEVKLVLAEEEFWQLLHSIQAQLHNKRGQHFLVNHIRIYAV